MGTFNIILLILNVILLILVIGKITQFYNLYQDNLRVQNDIENLVQQNSQLVNIILDELEGKIQEARRVMEGLETRDVSRILLREPEKNDVAPPPQLQAATTKEIPQEAVLDLNDAASSKIFYMRQMGMSVQEIAQKLQMSQGEIDLKLNLHDKHNTNVRKLRKLK